jgi:hypothetical protein
LAGMEGQRAGGRAIEGALRTGSTAGCLTEPVLSRGLLCAERDDHATGPLFFRPTPRLLQLLGAETLEEARRRLGERFR